MPWDTAAGWLLVVEAGGQVTNLKGAPFALDAPHILASNGRIHESMIAALRSRLLSGLIRRARHDNLFHLSGRSSLDNADTVFILAPKGANANNIKWLSSFR